MLLASVANVLLYVVVVSVVSKRSDCVVSKRSDRVVSKRSERVVRKRSEHVVICCC